MSPDRLLHALRTSRLREFVAALAISAFFLTALIPQGYMPGSDGAGLTLCTAQGAIALANDGTLPRPDGDSHDAGLAAHCPFALAVAALAPPAAPAQLSAPAPVRVAARVAAGIGPTRLSGPPRSQGSRAPPR